MAEITAGDRVPMMLNSLVGEPQEVALPPLGDLHWNADRRTRVPRTMSCPSLPNSSATSWATARCTPRASGSASPTATTTSLERLVELGRELFGLEAHLQPCQGYTEVALHSVPLTIWWEACGFAKLRPSSEHSGKGWTPHIPDAVLHSNDRDVYAGLPARPVRGRRQRQPRLCVLVDDERGVLARRPDAAARAGLRHDVAGIGRLARQMGHAVPPPAAAQRGNGYTIRRRDRLHVRAQERRRSSRPSTRRLRATTTSRSAVSSSTSLAPENDALRKTMLMSLARNGTVSRRSATALLERERRASSSSSCSATSTTRSRRPSCWRTSRRSTSRCPTTSTYVANGFVSHNTISFLMDCDTTGVEPDFSLVKFKELVGGGQMTIVNQTIPMALRTLGYTEAQIEAIEAHIDEHATIVGAPGLAASTCRSSTSQSASARSRTWATSR